MSLVLQCPECNSLYVYEDRALFVCSECAYEWSVASLEASKMRVVRDAYGTVLSDGDAVVVIKDMKVKGTSLVLKIGIKAKAIRLVHGDHDIDCRIHGFGAMQLKSEFVKKA